VNAPLPAAVPGERFEFTDAACGQLSCYVAGQGPPLLLVHTINASGTAAEVRPLFEHFSATHTVYAPDLPGYGFSQRSDRPYTPRLMTDALHATVQQIQARGGAQPVDAVAASLSCEFLARAAVERAGDYGRLALVSPTGFSGRRARRGPGGSTYAIPLMLRLLRGPGWGQAVFRGLTRPGVIRYFLARTWGSPKIDEPLWAYDLLTTRQPGAEFAPLHFLAAYMFSADIHDVYDRVSQPVWMSHGVRGDFTDFRGAAFVRGRVNWRFSVFQTGALPYFELPSAFNAELAAFLSAR